MNKILLTVATAVTVMALRAGAAYSNPPYAGAFGDDITPEVKASVSGMHARYRNLAVPIVPQSLVSHMTYGEARGFVKANHLEANLGHWLNKTEDIDNPDINAQRVLFSRLVTTYKECGEGRREGRLCAEVGGKLFGPPAVGEAILGFPLIKSAAPMMIICDCKEKGSGNLFSRFLGQVTGASAEEALRGCQTLPSAYGGQFRRVWVEGCKTFSQ